MGVRTFNAAVKIGFAVILILAILSEGCAANKPHKYTEYPDGGRIYRTIGGDTLRVDSEGKVYGYPGNKRFGPGEHGTASKIEDEWDMSSFDVETTGAGTTDVKTADVKTTSSRCEILFPVFWSDKAVKERYVSCWNRAWEIPAFVIVLPVLMVGAVVLVTLEGVGAAVDAIKK
jgi:hypothetical protein